MVKIFLNSISEKMYGTYEYLSIEMVATGKTYASYPRRTMYVASPRMIEILPFLVLRVSFDLFSVQSNTNSFGSFISNKFSLAAKLSKCFKSEAPFLYL